MIRLSQHLLAHTNGRLGMVFANQEIEVVEVVDMESDIAIHPELESELYTDKDER
jgi:hypothetical protein